MSMLVVCLSLTQPGAGRWPSSCKNDHLYITATIAWKANKASTLLCYAEIRDSPLEEAEQGASLDLLAAEIRCEDCRKRVLGMSLVGNIDNLIGRLVTWSCKLFPKAYSLPHITPYAYASP